MSTQVIMSDTTPEMLKDMIFDYGSESIGLSEFRFMVRSYKADGANNHIFECVFDEDTYDEFVLDEFLEEVSSKTCVGYSLFLPDGSPVLKIWNKGESVCNICEPEDLFEVSAEFQAIYPKIVDFDSYHDAVEESGEDDINRILLKAANTITKSDQKIEPTLLSQRLFSFSENTKEEITDFEISDFGDCIDIDGTDFNYWC
ncbi:hypothetical protein [Microbulbifer sp. PAAF003]|uniref:hypothetical protein n=1 Tax=Microbulbifer sp. PAAF003 TaxID=3243375 RepID=UPI00403946CB